MARNLRRGSSDRTVQGQSEEVLSLYDMYVAAGEGTIALPPNAKRQEHETVPETATDRYGSSRMGSRTCQRAARPVHRRKGQGNHRHRDLRMVRNKGPKLLSLHYVLLATRAREIALPTSPRQIQYETMSQTKIDAYRGSSMDNHAQEYTPQRVGRGTPYHRKKIKELPVPHRKDVRQSPAERLQYLHQEVPRCAAQHRTTLLRCLPSQLRARDASSEKQPQTKPEPRVSLYSLPGERIPSEGCVRIRMQEVQWPLRPQKLQFGSRPHLHPTQTG